MAQRALSGVPRLIWNILGECLDSGLWFRECCWKWNPNFWQGGCWLARSLTNILYFLFWARPRLAWWDARGRTIRRMFAGQEMIGHLWSGPGEYLDRDQRTLPKIILSPNIKSTTRTQRRPMRLAFNTSYPIREWRLVHFSILLPSEDPGCCADNGGFISRIIFTLHH